MVTLKYYHVALRDQLCEPLSRFDPSAIVCNGLWPCHGGRSASRNEDHRLPSFANEIAVWQLLHEHFGKHRLLGSNDDDVRTAHVLSVVPRTARLGGGREMSRGSRTQPRTLNSAAVKQPTEPTGSNGHESVTHGEIIGR